MKPVAFVSGHLDVSAAEFAEHYLPEINAALAAGHQFVVGDAAGADRLGQEFLAQNLLPAERNRVTVFHMFTSPRHNAGGFPTRGGYQSDNERDATMTAASTYDIAWVRPGREKSGTAKNIKRRNQQPSKSCLADGLAQV